jgi:hypothetical protein
MQLKALPHNTPDCYVRPGEYLHHMYIDGVKYLVAYALRECLIEARKGNDIDALRHLNLHKEQLDALVSKAQRTGGLSGKRMLGPPPPKDDYQAKKEQAAAERYVPPVPEKIRDLGLNRALVNDMVLRLIYNQGRPTAGEISRALCLSYRLTAPLLEEMRQQEMIDIAGRKGLGDINYEYVLTKIGNIAIRNALEKTAYSGPMPVPFKNYLKAIKSQTIKNMVVTRRNIRTAFNDLIISDPVLNEIGPAINSADSIFLFGYPGNGKTSVAERITRLMGDYIFLPYAIEVNGQIIQIFDTTIHEKVKDEGEEAEPYDLRWAKIKRPVVVVGGELTLPMLNLIYNPYGKYYEAPLQMKANGGLFMIDDFGRQQVAPMDLLNRWIVPLEKKYDYLTTVSGMKIEVPFDQILIFSTNLDPNQLADDAFLRRIKFKIEIRDPDEAQWRQIWGFVCKSRKVKLDQRGLDYLVEKWFKPDNRPFRMCQPRDLLNQMTSIAGYNMEPVTFSPDLIDAACDSYFISKEKKDFGAAVRLD